MIIGDILSALRRRWWVLVACVLIGMAITGVANILTPTQYTSTARLLVATPNIDQSAQVPPGGISATQRAVNYANLVTGNTIPDQVIAQLQLAQTLPELLQQVHVNVLSGTTIIEIAVDDADAAQSQRIAQAFAADLAAYVPKIESASGATDSPATVTITDNANLPQPPAADSILSALALGLFGGLVVGAVLIWLWEVFDTRIRRAEKLPELTGAALLGSVPAGGQASPDPLIANEDPDSDTADAYRTVRTALQFAEVSSTVPVFVVTDASASAGAAAVAANIATSMAQTSQRTLLIDADLRQPQVAGLVGLPAGPGLAEILAGTATLVDCIHTWSAGGLDVITAGGPARLPTEDVQSKSMDVALAEARSQYDVVVVAASALSQAPDASLIASAADGAVLVVRNGQTSVKQVHLAVQRLDVARATLLGTVLVGGAGSGTLLPVPQAKGEVTDTVD